MFYQALSWTDVTVLAYYNVNIDNTAVGLALKYYMALLYSRRKNAIGLRQNSGAWRVLPTYDY